MSIELVSVKSLASKSQPDLVALFVSASNTGRVAYLNATKALIALAALLGDSVTKAAAILAKEGVARHTIKSAEDMVHVYNTFVKPGHVTEEWFDGIIHGSAVALNKVTAKRGVTKVLEHAKEILSGSKMAWAELEIVANDDKCLFRDERTVAKEREEEKAVKAAATSEDKDATGGKKAKGAAKAKDTPLTELEEAIEKASLIMRAILKKDSSAVTVENVRKAILKVQSDFMTATAKKTETTAKVKAA